MKYRFLPRAMWLVFRGSFQKELPSITQQNSGVMMRKANKAFRRILSTIPEFDENAALCAQIIGRILKLISGMGILYIANGHWWEPA